MKTAHLADLEVSRIGLGAMTMAGTYTSEGALDDEEYGYPEGYGA